MLKAYYQLTKPGIIMGNAITAIAGFFLAAELVGHVNLSLFLAMLAGVSLVIASACVFNNYIDRGIDAKMARTKHRALVKGEIPVLHAMLFASALLLGGVLVLGLYTNLLTTAVALAGFLIYVCWYSFSKHRSTSATLVGSLAGAVPPVVGYCAVTAHFDLAALFLFLIVVFWQMPHFYAIAMYRFHDYAAASIPVLPVKKGMHTTKIHMLLYIVAFIGSTVMLTVLGYTGYVYLVVSSLLGLAWLRLSIKGLTGSPAASATLGTPEGMMAHKQDQVWARKMFLFSLVVITALSTLISINTLLI